MKSKKTHIVSHRRKREGKTNYKKRLKFLLSEKPRLVVRRSVNDMIAQIIKYDEKGDKVVASVKGKDLEKIGWNFSSKNLPGGYLLGLLISKKAKENKIEEAILDMGLHKPVPGSKIYAVLKGAIDNGLKIPYSKEILPSENRIMGKHIEDYANKLNENKEMFEKKFSRYLKNNADPTKITQDFEKIKNKIIGA